MRSLFENSKAPAATPLQRPNAQKLVGGNRLPPDWPVEFDGDRGVEPCGQRVALRRDGKHGQVLSERWRAVK